MVERDLTEMTAEEFDALIDGYIERSSRRDDEVPAEAFLELLFETSVEQVQETIQLRADYVNGALQFDLPTDREATIQTRGNQILVGDKLIVVSLGNGNHSHAEYEPYQLSMGI